MRCYRSSGACRGRGRCVVNAHPVDWDEVYRAQAPRLRGVIARRVEASAVEDVLQETFLRAYRSSDRFDASRPIEPWLTTIAVHAAADSRRRTASEPLLQRLADARAGHAPDVAEEYVANERGRLVRRAFESLTGRHRGLLLSVALDDASQASVARDHGLTPEAVRATVMRARRRFRAVYDRLVQEQGLAGLGGTLRPVVTRMRARLLPVERSGTRPAEALTALFAVVAVAGLAGLGAPRALSGEAPEAEVHRQQPVVGTAPRASAPGASSPRTTVDVRMSVGTAGGGIEGSLTRDGAAVDTIWTLRIDPTGVEVTVGTDGSTARAGVRTDHTVNGRSSRGEAGINVESCDDGVTVRAECDVLDVIEPVLESTD